MCMCGHLICTLPVPLSIHSCIVKPCPDSKAGVIYVLLIQVIAA